MGFTHLGNIGHANNKAAQATCTLTITQDVPVGSLVVVWHAWGTNGASGGGGNGKNANPTFSVTDSQGNLYTNIATREDSGTTQPSFGLFVARITVALSVGDTITDTYYNTTITPKAISAHAFSMDAGMTWAANDRGPANVTQGTGDPINVGVSSMTSQEYLGVHVLASKGPDTDAYTWDSSWTQITGDGTTGGLDTSNAQLRGGWWIKTATSFQTTGITSDTADRIYRQGMACICQVPIPSFPTTPLLDDFNRADENPLDNGTWDATTCCGQFNAHLKIVSNVAMSASASAGSWWLTQNAVEDAEVFATMPTGVEGGVLLHGSGCGNNSTRSGYECEWQASGTRVAGDQLAMGQMGNSADVSGGAGWRTRINGTAGYKVGLQKQGRVLLSWVDRGSGWECCAGMYCDAFVRSSGKMGLVVRSSTPRMDDFGGGEHRAVGHLLPILGVGA